MVFERAANELNVTPTKMMPPLARMAGIGWEPL